MSALRIISIYKTLLKINLSKQSANKIHSINSLKTKYRSSHPRCSIRKAVLKNFAIFTGKHLCWSLCFNKVVYLQTCNFIKKRLQHRCFPVNIAKFLRNPILKNICEQLLLKVTEKFTSNFLNI